MEHEAQIRLIVFVSLFAAFASFETFWPRRLRKQKRLRRWATNWAIIVLDSVMLRLLAVVLPLLAVGAAMDAQSQGWGLLNWVDLPIWLEIIGSIFILDFVIWAQHWITHRVPVLWRLHRVHHADVDIDVTTAIRFHPIEIGLSMLLKIGVVYLLGPSAFSVVLFEVILNGTAMFNHANIRIPLQLDKVIRTVLVTPDMHRVHHSVYCEEHNSNYGFALSIWDRLFGTYIAQPQDGHDEMKIGLQWQDDRPAKLGWSLLLPFLRRP
ncbi:fatty acid hydroxylase [Sulfitobacter sp. SK012]|uniref:sterol desaturase family protein n=1 Tax=Sulfitobacter sp. SK012 TaxID=1389005 RepID=UPI000E0B62FA|nr:sterol desaturase family protein [Sulfitobacter sp. SK012]AXI47201.1 fatty acid hydroxylase [Sulfitobacter sp. SK012]